MLIKKKKKKKNDILLTMGFDLLKHLVFMKPINVTEKPRKDTISITSVAGIYYLHPELG